jgi:hypothetical protein
MPNSDNTYGTFNKRTHILSQIDDGSTALQNFADVDAAKSYFYTTDALSVWETNCTNLQWALVADGNGDNTKLKITFDFGTKGGQIDPADDWAELYNTAKTNLIDTPLKSFSISNAVQTDTDPITGTWEVNITATGHTFQAGDFVKISGVQGMTQLNTDSIEIESVDGNNFLIIPSSNSFSAYTSGGTVESAYKNKWTNNNYTTEDSTDHLF